MTSKCTCVGCDAERRPYTILAHLWQDQLWENEGKFEGCYDEECELRCPSQIDAEDLLCSSCRRNHGISSVNTTRIEEMLRSVLGPVEP